MEINPNDVKTMVDAAIICISFSKKPEKEIVKTRINRGIIIPNLIKKKDCLNSGKRMLSRMANIPYSRIPNIIESLNGFMELLTSATKLLIKKSIRCVIKTYTAIDL